jgi:hypothetical protein
MTGYSSDVGDPFGNGSSVLALGMPGTDVEGRVYSSAENFVQGGAVLLVKSSDMQEVAFYTGDRMFSRFGSVVKVTLFYFCIKQIQQFIVKQKIYHVRKIILKLVNYA